MSVLTPEQLEQTWTEWFASQSTDVLELLVLQYEGLALYHARRAASRAPAFQDREEIASWARLGLIDAIRKFSPEGGASFVTYAATRIPGAIKDGQRGQDPLTRAMRHQVKLVDNAIDELWEKYQREPTLADIADATSLTVETVRLTQLMRQSVNGTIPEDHEGYQARELTSHSEGDVAVHVAEVRTLVAERISALSPRCLAFLISHYVEGRNMTETCKRMEIGADWARQTRHLTIAGLTN